jgi:hypothetical protein
VAFLQGAVTLSQEIFGLTPGKTYWLQFRYNARAAGGTVIDLSVKLAGSEIKKLGAIAAVGENNPYNFINVPFTAAGPSGLLEFITSVGPGVDATLLLDAVSIVQREPGEVVVENPSFEASGSPVGVGYLGPVAGWPGASGVNIGIQPFGPFTDNGAAPDQDRVLFKQGGGTLAQRIFGLEAGAEYMLVYSVNRRNCCGAAALTHSVSFAEQPLVVEEEVAPVGGDNPYVTKSVAFEATDTEGDLVFTIATQGDASFLIDDVHIVPTGPPPVRFVRGDADASGSINLTDGIVVLNFLFSGGPAPKCLDAGDTDDTGRPLAITDAIRIFNWLFTGGAAPLPPSPTPGQTTYLAATCGTDPTPNDGLDCATVAQTCR